MAEIQVFKTKITNACALIKSSEPHVTSLEQAFTFPQQIEEFRTYIAEKTAQLNNLTRTISSAKQFHDSYVKRAIERINGRAEHKEREKLMLDLNRHLESESNSLEIKVIQWLNQIDFRKEELLQQTSLLASSTPPHSRAVANTNSSCQKWSNGAITPQERNIRVRRPLLEVPTFSGNYREFSTFWSIFESLIHNDAELSDQEKFLFLNQALKGKAAASVSSIPVIGAKYATAVNILKKHYDRSASIADILINEIERLPRAQENPRSCRETLEAISSRIIHLEQTGVPMNADRMWRRLLLSKFTESICGTVITKENEAGIPFDVNKIIDVIDEIITLQETIELTTRTLFGFDQSLYRSQQESTLDSGLYSNQKIKRTCLCGEMHSPQDCHKFDSPEKRRAEAKRQRVCWRCFSKGHSSRLCSTDSKCSMCNDDHHASLCSSIATGLPPNSSSERSYLPSPTNIHALSRSAISKSNNCFIQPSGENYQRQTSYVRKLRNKSLQKNIIAEPHQPTLRQPVVQMKSTNQNSEMGCSSTITATPLISLENDYKTKNYESESLVTNAVCGTDEALTHTFAHNHREAITTKQENITGVSSTEEIEVIEEDINVAIDEENFCLQSEDDGRCDHKIINIRAKQNSLDTKLILHIQDCTTALTDSPARDFCSRISGDGIAFSCYSQRQVLVETENDQTMLPMKCKPSTLQTTTKIHEIAPTYADICRVTCDKEDYNVIPELRALHTHWNASSDLLMTTNYINHPNMEHFLNIATEHWRISSSSVVATAIVAIVLLVSRILSRILFYQLKTQTVLPLLLYAYRTYSLDFCFLIT